MRCVAWEHEWDGGMYDTVWYVKLLTFRQVAKMVSKKRARKSNKRRKIVKSA